MKKKELKWKVGSIYFKNSETGEKIVVPKGENAEKYLEGILNKRKELKGGSQ